MRHDQVVRPLNFVLGLIHDYFAPAPGVCQNLSQSEEAYMNFELLPTLEETLFITTTSVIAVQ